MNIVSVLRHFRDCFHWYLYFWSYFFNGRMVHNKGVGDLGLTSECCLAKSIKVLFAQTSVRQRFHP